MSRSSGLFVFTLLFGMQLFAASCAVSTNGLAFGVYNPLDSYDVATSSAVSIRCTSLKNNERVKLAISLSTGNSGSYTARTMMNGSETLSYNIYTTANYSNVWGNGTGISNIVTDRFFTSVSAPTTMTYTLYARILGGQDAAVGSYNDTITITVEY